MIINNKIKKKDIGIVSLNIINYPEFFFQKTFARSKFIALF